MTYTNNHPTLIATSRCGSQVLNDLDKADYADRNDEYEVIKMSEVQTTILNKHYPGYSRGVLGCVGYDAKGNVAFVADSSGNYKELGIVEGSIVFAQSLCAFEEGKLSVFSIREEETDYFQLSRTKVPGEYLGRVIAVFTDLSEQN